eukprot:1150554-Pelagomonas_calceolata.AAC.4
MEEVTVHKVVKNDEYPFRVFVANNTKSANLFATKVEALKASWHKLPGNFPVSEMPMVCQGGTWGVRAQSQPERLIAAVLFTVIRSQNQPMALSEVANACQASPIVALQALEVRQAGISGEVHGQALQVLQVRCSSAMVGAQISGHKSTNGEQGHRIQVAEAQVGLYQIFLSRYLAARLGGGAGEGVDCSQECTVLNLVRPAGKLTPVPSIQTFTCALKPYHCNPSLAPCLRLEKPILTLASALCMPALLPSATIRAFAMRLAAKLLESLNCDQERGVTRARSEEMSQRGQSQELGAKGKVAARAVARALSEGMLLQMGVKAVLPGKECADGSNSSAAWQRVCRWE